MSLSAETRRLKLEQSYLEHILIFVRADDRSANMLRSLTDNWFAYSRGGPYLNRNGNPHWFNNPSGRQHVDALRSMHFLSAGAAAVIAGRSDERLMVDHAIPLKVLRTLLANPNFVSIEDVRQALQNWYRRGVITKAEDKLLSIEFKQDMPTGWHWDGTNWSARYSACGIAVCPEWQRQQVPSINQSA